MGKGLVNLDFGGIITGVGNIIDDLHTSDEERQANALKSQTLETGLLAGQNKVNEVSAAHPSLFVAGARPAMLWICALGFGWAFVIYPLFCWVFELLQAFGHIPYYKTAVIQGVETAIKITTPKPLDTGPLMTLATGMLGLGGMRMYEGIKGVKRDNIAPVNTTPKKKGFKWPWTK